MVDVCSRWRIKHLREKSGYTRAQLSSLTGIDERRLERFEMGSGRKPAEGVDPDAVSISSCELQCLVTAIGREPDAFKEPGYEMFSSHSICCFRVDGPNLAHIMRSYYCELQIDCDVPRESVTDDFVFPNKRVAIQELTKRIDVYRAWSDADNFGPMPYATVTEEVNDGWLVQNVVESLEACSFTPPLTEEDKGISTYSVMPLCVFAGFYLGWNSTGGSRLTAQLVIDNAVYQNEHEQKEFERNTVVRVVHPRPGRPFALEKMKEIIHHSMSYQEMEYEEGEGFRQINLPKPFKISAGPISQQKRDDAAIRAGAEKAADFAKEKENANKLKASGSTESGSGFDDVF